VAATISDVARRAGVSTATVSRVLSGVGRASPATRARVVASAGELGYRPSGIARALKRQSSRTIGLLVTDIQNPYFPEIVRAVEDAALDRDFAVLLCTGDDDPEREAAYLDLLADRRVDGIVVATRGVGERYGAWLGRAPLPVVLVNCSPGETGLPAILTDNRTGGRLAAEHLLGLGHRRLGYIGGPAHDGAAAERQAGIEEAMAAAGLSPGALVVLHGDGRVPAGERATSVLLEGASGATGIVCFNDLTAIGALRAARAHELRVPDDLSVVGYDDVNLAAYVDPPLTTIVQDKSGMGRWAVEAIAALIAGRVPGSFDGRAPGERPAPAEVVRLQPTLRIRGSTGPAPR
jgi:LacI family transcriptional regulator